MANIIIFLVLLLIGYISGRILERNHFRAIANRENVLRNLITTNVKHPVGDLRNIREVRLVQGSVVISIDYYKRLLAGIRAIFGGNIRAYETLLERARREATLRLKESCPDATQIINLRIETSSIYKGKRQQVGSVEVLAYATAVYN